MKRRLRSQAGSERLPEERNVSHKQEPDTAPESSVPDLEDLIEEAPLKRHGHKDSYHMLKTSEVDVIRLELLEWYDANQRVLPWRIPSEPYVKTRTQSEKQILGEQSIQKYAHLSLPYAVWVSEIMLQQTQVATVISYYKTWMKSWPTIDSLARADIEEVNSVWQGLGYYSRAKRLHDAAKMIVDEVAYNQLQGELPNTASALAHIPGIGRYTSAAIASIAYGEAVGVVDGNVIRVLSRMRSLGCDYKNAKRVEIFWQLSNFMVDIHRPGDFNQAIMELGAKICVPKTPNCSECPVSSHCRAYAEAKAVVRQAEASFVRPGKHSNRKKMKKNMEKILDNRDPKPCDLCGDGASGTGLGLVLQPNVSAYPFKKPKKQARKAHVAVSVVERTCTGDGKHITEYLMVKRVETGLLAGLWEFPSVDIPTQTDDKENEVDNVLSSGIRSSLVNALCESEMDLSLSAALYRVEVGSVLHVFSHIHNTYHIERVVLPPVTPEFETEISVKLETTENMNRARTFQWTNATDLETLALSTAMRKVLKKVTGQKNIKAKSSVKREECGLKQPTLMTMAKRKH
eukprot:CFRG7096T1